MQFTRATLHGDIDTILKVKEPVEIEHIFDSKPGKTLHCILVEGAPGVGKTTLAWHLCHRWGRGDLFQQYALVILVKLREEVMRKAESLADLLISQEDKQKKITIAEQLKETNGKNVLVILEGLDEFPTYLLTRCCVITELLSGTLLPRATILVTSRPSATVQLWDRWKCRISRHIEVLGFTKENIAAYIRTNLNDDECKDFEKYLTINTPIRALMYIPINCTIVIAVYKDCLHYSKPLPRTITELYTCLVESILRRHLKSHDYNEKCQTLTSLPPSVDADFQALKELAYEGVLRQQYIYSKEIEHLGLMDVVVEQHSFQYSHSFSYNFLHLSIQEYLAAHYISSMPFHEQEQFLKNVCNMKHLRNTCRFLAGITKFKCVDRTVLSKVIHDRSNTTLSKQDEENQKIKHRIVRELLESIERLIDHVESGENKDENVMEIVIKLLKATERLLERKYNILEEQMEEWKIVINLLTLSEMLIDYMRMWREVVSDLLHIIGRLGKQLNRELEGRGGMDGLCILYHSKEQLKIQTEMEAGIVNVEAYSEASKKITLSSEKQRFVEKELKTKIHEDLRDIEYKMSGILRISTFALQLLYECEDCGVLECHKTYQCTLTDYSPLINFSALGCCIAHSSCAWRLQLGQVGTDGVEMQSTEGIEMLAHELRRYGDLEAHYRIRALSIHHENLNCTQQLLESFPECVYSRIESLELQGASLQPLPQRMPHVLSKMIKLQSLFVRTVTPDTLFRTLQALAFICLTEFQLTNLELSPSVMKILCSSLRNYCNTLFTLNLSNCGINDKKALCLAQVFPNFTALSLLYLSINIIGDKGAIAIAEATREIATLCVVDLRRNKISLKVQLDIKKYKYLIL